MEKLVYLLSVVKAMKIIFPKIKKLNEKSLFDFLINVFPSVKRNQQKEFLVFPFLINLKKQKKGGKSNFH